MSSNNSTSIFIGRHSLRAKEFYLERFFKGFEKIHDINLKQGQGFVEFADTRSKDNAFYEMNNQSLCGRRITIEHAKEIPQLRNFNKTVEVTGIKERFMAGEEETTVIMMTGTGPNTVLL